MGGSDPPGTLPEQKGLIVKKLLLIAAVILFLATAIGYGTVHAGTVTLSLLGFGLACFAGSFLVTT